MISEDRVEKAVEFIRDHAHELGLLIGQCKGLEQKRKAVHGQAFLGATGTVAEREARAYSSPLFQACAEEIQNAWADKETLSLKIEAAKITVDVWRSQNSAANRGNI